MVCKRIGLAIYTTRQWFLCLSEIKAYARVSNVTYIHLVFFKNSKQNMKCAEPLSMNVDIKKVTLFSGGGSSKPSPSGKSVLELSSFLAFWLVDFVPIRKVPLWNLTEDVSLRLRKYYTKSPSLKFINLISYSRDGTL